MRRRDGGRGVGGKGGENPWIEEGGNLQETGKQWVLGIILLGDLGEIFSAALHNISEYKKPGGGGVSHMKQTRMLSEILSWT